MPKELRDAADYIFWKVGQRVSPAQETEMREAVLAAHDYATRLGMPRIDRPITISSTEILTALLLSSKQLLERDQQKGEWTRQFSMEDGLPSPGTLGY